MTTIKNETRICSKCQVYKPLEMFFKGSKYMDGYRSECKECKIIYNNKNKAYLKVWKRIWYLTNTRIPDLKSRMNSSSKLEKAIVELEKLKINILSYKTEGVPGNKKTVLRRDKKYNKITRRIADTLRTRMSQLIRKGEKGGSTVKDLGCSIDEFKIYTEKLWSQGMTWDNYGKGQNKWCFDHIKALVSFDLTDREQFLKACHYTNLRPMWWIDNCIKAHFDRQEVTKSA